MNFTCNECNDTGSRDKLGTYLDCNACGTAATRRDLNDFVKSLGPTHPEDVALAIHQRALAMGISASVEDTLNEMQPGGALHMPQDPAGYVFGNQYWEAGTLRLTDEIKRLGTPLYEHAIPVLAMAPKHEPRLVAQIVNNERDNEGNYINCHIISTGDHDIEHLAHGMKLYDAAPAAANGAMTDALIAGGALRQLKHNDGSEGFVCAYDKDVTDRILAAAGPDAALVKALESALAIINNEADPEEYAAPLKFIRAALSGAKGN